MIKEYFKRLLGLSFITSKAKERLELPNLDKVYLLYNSKKKFSDDYYVDNQTADDLSLDNLFLRINYTSSKLGQQYLYYLLRYPPKEKNILEYINYCDVNHDSKNAIKKKLQKLNSDDDYHIISYLTNESIQEPKWLYTTYLIQVFLVGALIFSFNNHFWIIPIMSLFILNFVLHYKTKQQFNNFFIGLSRITVLYKTVNCLFRSNNFKYNKISPSLDKAKSVLSKLWLFQSNSLQQSEVAMIVWLLIEIIKIVSLVEVQATYRISKRFENYKPDFLALYFLVAEIDVAISIVEFRKSLPVYTIPTFTDTNGYIEFENVCHPLVDDCHPNSILINNKSVFITGSNMSGKTTFLRTVAINMLLARSINTCFASKAILVECNVYSSININDELDEGKSFYLAELSRLKYFVDLSTEPKQNNLFLIDEILKGTNGYDRCLISEGILKFMIESDKNIIIASSHDIDLIGKLKCDYKLYHFKEDIKENELVFDFLLKDGSTTKSNAIKFLKLLQFPDIIINQLKA